MRTAATFGMSGMAAAVAVGIAFMATHDAPMAGIAINLASLGLGAAVWWVGGRLDPMRETALPAIAVIAGALLATAAFGDDLDGVRRWLRIGPVTIHVAMLTCPALLVLHARRAPSRLGIIAVAAASLALMAQPDRGSAGAFAAALLAIAAVRRGRSDAALAVLGLAVLAVTLIRPDWLAPIAFVEHVLADGWAASPYWGLALTAAAALLLLPLAAFAQANAHDRAALAGWMAWTGGLLAASLLGDYPAPAIGIGASAIVGHAIAATLVARSRGRPPT